MHPAPSIPQVDSIIVLPWPDPVIDTVGHDPRSTYVETFWLGVLGPSTTWLLRHIATGFDTHPDGFELPLADTARRLGLGDKGGRHSPFMRALGRCVQFDLACVDDTGEQPVLSVRRKVPPLSRRQVVKLPELLQVAHQRWQEHQLRTPPVEQMRRRSRQLALSLVELGEDSDEVERQLMRWGFHPSVCGESTRWALEQHEHALNSAASNGAA
jgi:hypothetical protein